MKAMFTEVAICSQMCGVGFGTKVQVTTEAQSVILVSHC